MTAVAERLPIDPLLVSLGIEAGRAGPPSANRNWSGDSTGDVLGGVTGALAARLGVSSRMAQRLAAHGLSVDQADRYAVAAGTLPELVWGAAWAALMPGEEDLRRGVCRCGTERRPMVGGDCDRCGRRIERRRKAA